MARRAPGGKLATSRREADLPEILSGLNERGETCGAPLAMRIVNGDTKSQDYAKLRDVPRPGHADYPAYVKFGGANDIRGGGQFSGRLTAPLCFAGALALQLLAREGIRVRAHIARIENAADAPLDPVNPDLDAISDGDLAVIDPQAAEAMRRAILDAKADCDSVGGEVECFATGVPAGLGDPMFDGVENRLARALFGIPAVRGVAFGAGFDACGMRGSAHNDAYRMRDGRVVTETNRHAGIWAASPRGCPCTSAWRSSRPRPSRGSSIPSPSPRARTPCWPCAGGTTPASCRAPCPSSRPSRPSPSTISSWKGALHHGTERHSSAH